MRSCPLMRPLVTVVALLSFLLSAGCGYTIGHTHVRTVALQVAGNETMRQRLELPLTRALQEALVVYAQLQPTTKDRADAILEVDLADARNRALVVARPEPLSEGSLALSVHVRLVDARNGEPIRTFTVQDRAEFRAAVGERESEAIREATIDLARKIALGLEADF